MELAAKRFWSRVNKVGADECWEWQGALTQGYGQLTIWGRVRQAHRVAWELTHGRFPENHQRGAIGTLVCHKCDNRKCVNPVHLFLGSALDNHRDMQKKGRNPIFSKSIGPAEAREIYRLVDLGVGNTDIGKRFGVTRGAIKWWRSKRAVRESQMERMGE